MRDLYLNWSGDLDFSDSGDLRVVDGQDYAMQRVARRLLTNPAVRDSVGGIVVMGDDMFNQDYGAGLGRDVDGLDTAQNRAQRTARIKEALAQEPSVDQSVAPTITEMYDPSTGIDIIVVEFKAMTGNQVKLGLRM